MVSVSVITIWMSLWRMEGVFDLISQLSRYIMRLSPFSARFVARTLVIFVKTLGAMVSPKGIWVNWYVVLSTLNARYFLNLVSTITCH